MDGNITVINKYAHMTLAEVIIFLLACFALETGIAYGEMPIIKWVREKLIKLDFFKKMFACPLCLGTWTSLALTVILFKLGIYYILPLAGAGFCLLTKWIFDVLFKDIEKN
jgi:hypothetical protein